MRTSPRRLDQFICPENKQFEKEHLAPLWRQDESLYRLVIETYRSLEGAWNITRGRVFRGEEEVADIHRNYNHFWFCWVFGHPDGHDYLLAGQDYQGQTIVQLDTGERIDDLPESAKTGHGFCWTEAIASPDRLKLAVDGCYWACSFEVVVFDFSKPMDLPYREIVRKDATGLAGWEDNERIRIRADTLVRKSDQKPFDELSEEEKDTVCDEDLEEVYTDTLFRIAEV